jgi:site-specific DNA-adenine methylase
MNGELKQLYTYFGCKKKIIERVWQAWGDVDMTVEPFAGTAIVSLTQPENHCVKNMYLNDGDCHIVNVMRSVLYNPDEVIFHAAHPRCELDMHMIHDYLYNMRPALEELCKSAIDACDPVAAGLWVWGCNNWLGNGWCSDLVKLKTPDALALSNTDLDEFKDNKIYTRRIKPNNRNRLTERLVTGMPRNKLTKTNQLTERLVTGMPRNKPNNRNRLTERLTDSPRHEHIKNLVYRIYHTLRDGRILYGDFERVLTKSYIDDARTCGIFLDPPYPGTYDGTYLYAAEENDAFSRSLKWFLDNCDNPKYRIVFCCQESNLVDVKLPKSVKKEAWSRDGGYAIQAKNDRHTEVMLFSRGCSQLKLKVTNNKKTISDYNLFEESVA